MATRLYSLIFALIAIISCSVTPIQKDDFYGEYRDTPKKSGGIVWEGDVVRIGETGYSHFRFTDELGVHPYEPPWKEYKGLYEISGNRIIFLESHLTHPERFLVKSGSRYYLLTPEEYKIYKYLFYRLPDYLLTKIGP